MTVRKRVAALAATAVVALGSVFAVASPAYAAPTCSYRTIGDTDAGMGGGYYFSCYNSTRGGVWLQITCSSSITGRNRNIRYEHRPVSYPWSLGHALYCSNLEFRGNPRWGVL